jgi:hypothetical protein
VNALAPALAALGVCPEEKAAVRAASARGHFLPEEDVLVRAWFARYQTVRGGLLEVIAELRPAARDEIPGVDEQTRLRSFLVAYTAAALLVSAARLLVDEVSTDRVVQRKLNEADPAHRLPRKGYTKVYRAMTDPGNAWRLAEAMRFADERRCDLNALAAEPELAVVLRHLGDVEDALRVGVRQYLKARLRYRAPGGGAVALAAGRRDRHPAR